MWSKQRIFLWLVALGAIVRGVYFTEHAESAFFNLPLLDERYYDSVARAWLEGRSAVEINPGFRPLLYPVFLAFWYTVAGDWGRILAIAFQHFLGIATALLVALFAMRLFRRPAAGAWAGGLYIFAAPPLFFEGELLITSLVTFLVALLLVLLGRLNEDGPPSAWVAAGLMIAVAAQARPNVLITLSAFLLATLFWRRGYLKTRAALAALALAGAGLGLLAFGFFQARLTGHLQLLGGAGGVNFYLGNKRGADGMVPRQDRPVTYGADYLDSVQVFAEEEYRAETGSGASVPEPGRISRYWFGRGLDEIRADPAAWLVLMAKKSWFLLWNREIPNNKTLAFIREHESAVLRLLPTQWWMLLALSPIGVSLAWRRGERRHLFWALAFAGLYALGVVLFFVNSRFRIPLWTVAAALAGGGLVALGEMFRQRDIGSLMRNLVLPGALALISLLNLFGIPPDSHARDFFFRSIAHFEKGQLEAALRDARQSVELGGASGQVDGAALYQLGTVALHKKDPRLALSSFSQAAELLPGEPRIWNNVGIALEDLDRPADAYRSYLRAIHLVEDYAPPYINAALLELRAGLVERAAAKVDRAEELGIESVPFFCALGLVKEKRGRLEAARRAFHAARRLDSSDAVTRILEEQLRPLSPEALDMGGGPR